MQRAARLPQQRSIGRVLDQRMFEQIGRMRGRSLPEQKAGMNETVERRLKLSLWLARYRHQKRMGKLSPDCRSYLCCFFRWAESVEPCHQRCVQACGNRE